MLIPFSVAAPPPVIPLPLSVLSVMPLGAVGCHLRNFCTAHAVSNITAVAT